MGRDKLWRPSDPFPSNGMVHGYAVGILTSLRRSFEKKGGNALPDREIENFREGLKACGLVDLGFQGYPFTWDNKRTIGFTEERLDRFVARENWSELFPTARVIHLDGNRPEHRPLICDIRG
ncbi:unnamed protein product [Linum trigynum]|uniref:Uncharacterized protein n=1 Tax=Linum trigynum TaxID=586398 RepID=A0AAV2F4Z7_9ROSI